MKGTVCWNDWFWNFWWIIDRTLSPYKSLAVQSDRSKISMNLKYRKDLAFTVASFYLRVVGFWLTTSRLEEWFRIGVVGYTILAITFSAWVQIRGLYFNWGDFSVSLSKFCRFSKLYKSFYIILNCYYIALYLDISQYEII